jgi:branched-chain amino acid transport system substrate-binding protein
VKLPCVCEFSCAAAAAGTHWRDCAKMAVGEINAAGSILGKKIEIAEFDMASDPQTSRALTQEAIGEGAYTKPFELLIYHSVNSTH